MVYDSYSGHYYVVFSDDVGHYGDMGTSCTESELISWVESYVNNSWSSYPQWH